MKKIIVLTIFFIHVLSFGQIDLKIVSLPENFPSTGEMTVIITNMTDNHYVFPLEKGFKGYYSNEICTNINSFDHLYNFFSFTVLLEDKITSEPATLLTRNYDTGDDEELIKKSKQEDYKARKEIINWKKENGIKTDIDARINRQIMNHLIFLEPKEKMILKINLDIFDIRRGKSFFYDSYLLEDKKQYDLKLQLCVDRNIHNSLTDQQKQKLSKYIFFDGQIISNSISFTYKLLN